MTAGRGEHAELFELLGALREGTATDEQLVRLDRLLASDPASQQTYVEYMLLCAELRRHHGTPEVRGADWETDAPETEAILSEVVEQDRLEGEQLSADQSRWEAQAHREAIRRAADTELDRFREQERLRLEELARREYLARRRQMAVTALTAAILLISAVMVWISRWEAPTSTPVVAPAPVAPPVVARITRSRNAQWRPANFSAEPGTQLTASAMSLTQGLVELTFDSGAEVLLQAPVSLRLESADQMFLEGGAVSVVLAEGSSGFIVRTPTGTVVDYGTEFGVIVNKGGETETHVYDGRVGLRSGSDPVRSVVSMILTAGEAGTVDKAGAVAPEDFRLGRIVREIPQEPSFGIPGRRLDLADVIGGGNGFGTGRAGAAICPLTGNAVDLVERDRNGRGRYLEVSWNRYVDGVFVPDGERARLVSSAGHVFAECPPTNNLYNMAITNIGEADCGPQTLDGRLYGSSMRPGILMHANLGITFDLDEIASANPGSQITRFRAGIGVSDRATDRPCHADFWVLVDGQVRFRQLGVRQKGMVCAVDVPLRKGDRFLTLITTDAGDVDILAPGRRATDSDWCIFAEPILELAPAAPAARDSEVKTMATANETPSLTTGAEGAPDDV